MFLFKVLLCILCFDIVPNWYNSSFSILRLVVNSLSKLGVIYASSSTILFVCLSLSLGALIRILSDQVEVFYNHKTGDNRAKKSNDSGDESIRKHLVLETLINNAFLMTTPSVVAPYYNWNQWAILYSMIVKDVAVLLLLAYVSHRLKGEVWTQLFIQM